ncbi:MAG: nicotinate-nucleotide adenylyltransferase [Gemmatimonadota bacterium]
MIGLLGGSFDPIHHGHLIVARSVLETLGLDAVRFVPARDQPFKAGQHGVSSDLRAQMVALAIRGEPRFVLERAELDRPGPSYTVDTLRALHLREPGADFALLLGADAAAEFHLWRESEEIRRLARLVVFSRPGLAGVPAGPGLAPLAVPAVDISATDIRVRVREGRSIRYLVPDGVAEFIAAHRLYLGQ